MQIKAGEIMKLMNQWAPPGLAESWDNPGLQTGRRDKDVRRILVALDVTEKNIDWASRHHVDMIISHHPLLFKSLKKIDADTEKGRMLCKLISSDIVSFAAHTNLDSTEEGVNDALAERLQLKNCTGFIPVRTDSVYQLVIHCAQTAGRQLAEVFSFADISILRDADDSMIHMELKVKEEQRRKVSDLIEKWSGLIYSTEWHRLCFEGKQHSMGRVGWLPYEMPAEAALAYVKDKLDIPALKFCGPVEKNVSRVAVLGGSGAEFARAAVDAGADMYITGDVKYHQGQDAAGMGLLLVDGGHFYTERVIVPYLAQKLRLEAEKCGWDVEVLEDHKARDVFNYLV